MTRYLLRPALLACTLALAGCYTVLQAPRGLVEEVALPEPAGQAAPDSGSVPDGSGTDAQWADLYDYPGVPSGYGGGYGYGGYTRGSEVFFYGAPPYPYYSAYPYYSLYGYGPYSYGYDPYYRDAYGYYVPAGYKLVTTTELDALRASLEALAKDKPAPDPAAEQERKLEEERKARESWTRRSQPMVRSAPAATPKSPSATSEPAASAAATTAPASTSSSSQTQATAAEKENTAKPSASPTKQRR